MKRIKLGHIISKPLKRGKIFFKKHSIPIENWK